MTSFHGDKAKTTHVSSYNATPLSSYILNRYFHSILDLQEEGEAGDGVAAGEEGEGWDGAVGDVVVAAAAKIAAAAAAVAAGAATEGRVAAAGDDGERQSSSSSKQREGSVGSNVEDRAGEGAGCEEVRGKEGRASVCSGRSGRSESLHSSLAKNHDSLAGSLEEDDMEHDMEHDMAHATAHDTARTIHATAPANTHTQTHTFTHAAVNCPEQESQKEQAAVGAKEQVGPTSALANAGDDGGAGTAAAGENLGGGGGSGVEVGMHSGGTGAISRHAESEQHSAAGDTKGSDTKGVDTPHPLVSQHPTLPAVNHLLLSQSCHAAAPPVRAIPGPPTPTEAAAAAQLPSATSTSKTPAPPVLPTISTSTPPPHATVAAAATGTSSRVSSLQPLADKACVLQRVASMSQCVCVAVCCSTNPQESARYSQLQIGWHRILRFFGLKRSTAARLLDYFCVR